MKIDNFMTTLEATDDIEDQQNYAIVAERKRDLR